MANEYLVNSDDLTAVADAIRQKGGTSDVLTFPGGFVNAVGSIEAGGGGDESLLKELVQRTITNIKVPSGLTKIGDSCFFNCTSLVDVDMPDTVTEIGPRAFGGCSKLVLTSLPEGLTTIDTYTFNGCTSLALTSLPEGLTTVKTSGFMGCTSLALTSLPQNFSRAEFNSFSGCSSLSFTSIPDNNVWLGSYAFNNCTGFTSMLFPGGITIADRVFNGCTGLTQITFSGIPKSVNGVAFTNCNNLITINVPWAEGEVSGAPWGATNATINYNYTEEV